MQPPPPGPYIQYPPAPGYPMPVVVYPPPAQPPKPDGTKTVIMVIVALVVVVGAVAGLWAFLRSPYSVGPPPPTKNIGVACVKTNATAYKCSIANADTGIDFRLVSIRIVDSGGRLECSLGAPITYSSGGVAMSCTGSKASSARLTDNGDGVFSVGDDAYIAPFYVPTPTSLAGLTFKVSGGGEGSAPLA